MKITRKNLRQMINEAIIDHSDDSTLAPQTARLMANVFVIGFENHPDGGMMSAVDKEESLDMIAYTMAKYPDVARKLYGHFAEMRLDAGKHEEQIGYDPRMTPDMDVD